MAGAGNEPRTLDRFISDARKRQVALERRQRGPKSPPVGAVLGFIGTPDPGYIPLDGRVVLASSWPLLVERLAPGEDQVTLPSVAAINTVRFCIRGE